MNSGTNFLQFPMQELHKTLLVIVWASKAWAMSYQKLSVHSSFDPQNFLFNAWESFFFQEICLYLCGKDRKWGPDGPKEGYINHRRAPQHPKKNKHWGLAKDQRIKAKGGEFISKKPCTKTTSIGCIAPAERSSMGLAAAGPIGVSLPKIIITVVATPVRRKKRSCRILQHWTMASSACSFQKQCTRK